MKIIEENSNFEKKFIRSFSMNKDTFKKLVYIARNTKRSRSNMIEILINNYYETLNINNINSIL